MRIHDILSGKGFDVIHAPPDWTVGAVVSLLNEHNLGAVVVSSDGRGVEGIVSERDVIRRLGADPELLHRPVSSIMTAEGTAARRPTASNR